MCGDALIIAALLAAYGAAIIVFAPGIHAAQKKGVSQMSRFGKAMWAYEWLQLDGYVHVIRIPGFLALLGALYLTWHGCGWGVGLLALLGVLAVLFSARRWRRGAEPRP